MRKTFHFPLFLALCIFFVLLQFFISQVILAEASKWGGLKGHFSGTHYNNNIDT